MTDALHNVNSMRVHCKHHSILDTSPQTESNSDSRGEVSERCLDLSLERIGSVWSGSAFPFHVAARHGELPIPDFVVGAPRGATFPFPLPG